MHLKPGREKSLLGFHPWVFSGAVQQFPECENGDFVAVLASDKRHLGYGMVSSCSQIACRMLSFDETPPEIALIRHIHKALQLRQLICPQEEAVRLINAEGDFLPGLIVDRYKDALVIQISTAGMEKKKPLIIEELISALQPKWIYEKSTASSRKDEGLQPFEATLVGPAIEPIEIREDDLEFLVSPTTGQKTGYFLDQREMRRLVKKLSFQRRVLNCFSYTGGFSMHALAGGATYCDSVDISKEAIARLQEHILLNGFQTKEHVGYAVDVFTFLKTMPRQYDFIILDPPAFAKKRADINRAAAGYKEINRLAMKALPEASLLLTCSCSYHIDEKLFRQILFAAARDAKRNVQILQSHIQAADHPISIYHPEGSYLKSTLLYVL
ncbi:MAG TPA: class I SAM-dependent rRNA methyltransferase [Chlamydiales bacterium]|nr:class I SAM-dependent rRNA methyltransferase [Chlamydiales bacterium]